MITCPCCGEHLLVFLDIPGSRYLPSQQTESSDLTHRFQTCAQCNTHTHQTLTGVASGFGKWKCDKCGHMAAKKWQMPIKEGNKP